MKIIKINILLAASLGAIIAFSGCSKDDGPIKKKIDITDVPTVTTNIDAAGSQAIDLLNLASFSGKFKVDLYFPGSTPPSKVDIVVRKWNGPAANNNNVKVFKAAVTTLPTSFTVSAAEIAALFGTPIVLGDNYDFGPDIYLGERKFEAFPAIGTGTGAGLNGQPYFGEFARFAAICAYDPAIYQGNFVVVSDAFQDVNPGTVIQLVKISNTSFSVTYPDAFIVPFPPPPIVVTVNTGNNALTIAKQKIGTKIYNTYDNINVQGGGSVSPCSQTATLNFNFTVDQGSFGVTPYVIKKQ